MSDAAKVSDEDLRWLFIGPVGVGRFAQGWLASGPALVVVTRGDAVRLGDAGDLPVER